MEPIPPLNSDGREVAIVYFRAGYTPTDYPSDQEWKGRLLVERSLAIKCPNIAYHLAGMKKVQQVLAKEGVVERFLSPEASSRLRQSFTGLYPLDDETIEKVLRCPGDYVLKPQREGGGNNFYGDDIPQKLKELTREDRGAYILMDRIKPPTVQSTLVRLGQVSTIEVVSELGIYGIFIGSGDKIYCNVEGGHLVRTKGSAVNEGGVAAGFAFLDSPILV